MPQLETTPKTIYVLWWRHSDGSGQEIVRAYTDAARADQDWTLVKDCHYRDYYLSQVPLLGVQNVE